MEARVNGKSVQVSGVEIRIGGQRCAPRPLGYFANAGEEHDPRQQLADYEHLAELAQKRAARRALRKGKRKP